jgi:hypothetical protein
MDRKKLIVIIVVLTLIGLLYFFALLFGLGASDDDKVSASTIQRSIGGRIERMFGKFSPRVQLGALECNGQSVSNTFKLTAPKPACDLAFPESEERYRKVELELVASAPVWLKSSSQEGADYKLNTNCVSYDKVTGSPRLEVTYRPGGENASGETCWIRQSGSKPVSFVVMAKGASLHLECRGCSQNPLKELALRLN